jgi:GTPase
MMDTVGFITNLPHGLVNSFKSTLQEVHQADILVHVRDVSHPACDFQKKAVLKVLRELEMPEEMLT